MKTLLLFLVFTVSLNIYLPGQTTTLIIEAPQNQYGNIELDYIWLSTDNTGFEENIYFMSPAVNGSLSGGYSIPYRSNSMAPGKQTVHVGEFEAGLISFEVPITCGSRYLRIRYSNNTPLNHSDIRIYYGGELVLQHTPLETSDWNAFIEATMLLDVTLPATISTSTTVLDFGTQVAGTTGSTNITVKNAGEEDLVISSVTIMSPFSADLTAPYTISCGEEQVISLSFSPQSAGDFTGNLVVASNDATTPDLTIALSGSGVVSAPGELALSHSSINFGIESVGNSATQQIKLTNTGEETLEILSIELPDPNFSFAFQSLPLTLFGGDSAMLDVSFAPQFAADISSTLTINTNVDGSHVLNLTGSGSINKPEATNLVILEDWTDILTANDFGYSDFAGNSGLLETHGDNTLEGTDLIFSWDFNTEFEAYTGRFFSLFGLTKNFVTFDGTNIDTIVWNDYYLNLNNIEGDHIISPYGSKRVDRIWMTLNNVLSESVKIKLELSDTTDSKCYKYFTLYPGENTISWDFRNEKTGTVDYSKCKLFSFIIERRHIVNNVLNPVVGELKFHQIGFETEQAYPVPSDNTQLLDLIQFRAFQYFIDYVGRRPDNLGFVQDRATFPDLYSVGGQGFTFAAWIIGIKNGWITETWVKERVLYVLNELGDTTNFGPDGTGKIGHRGFFYHFLGPDGNRKINFDWPETPVDESRNTVELSFIDTGLLLWGLYALQSYFVDDIEIYNLCQKVLDNVDWDFLLDDAKQQFYLGWKPEQDSLYSIPASSGGYYSNKTDGGKLLADWYSDEYLLCILAALGSEKHPVSINTWDSLIYEKNSSGTILSYPGSLFTYQFLSLFYPTHLSKIAQIDWFANSSGAVNQTAEYCSINKSVHKSYEEGYSGLSACEGPADLYHAYGASPVAKGGGEDDGTISVYPIVSSLIFPDHKDMAMNQLWSLYNAGYFHKRSGMPDAFHLDVSEVSELPDTVLRDTGTWLNRPNFAIDAGPMVIALQNLKDSLIWKLILDNPNVSKAIELANSYPQLEVSDSTLNFGIIAQGETESRNITLVNRGERELVILSLIIENPQFKIQNDISFPKHLKKDEVLILDVGYTSTGMKDTAILSIESNDHERQQISIHLSAGSYVLPEITSITLKHVLCNGDSSGSLIISANSQKLYYSIDSGASWGASNVFINLPADDYYVLIKDTNEVTSSWNKNPVSISEPARIELKITSQNASCTTCADGTIKVEATGGIPPYTHSLDDLVYVEDSIFSNLTKKKYTVNVMDSNACKVSEIVDLTPVVSAAERKNLSFYIFPNPVRELLTVEGMENTKHVSMVKLLNISGEILHMKEYETNTRLQLNVSHLQPGVYFIKIINRDKTYLSRFIKE